MNRIWMFCISTAILLLSIGSNTVQAASTSCPKTVANRSQITATCSAKAAALIKSAGYYNIQTYQQANGIKDYALQTSTIGPKTYNWAMSGSKLTNKSTNLKDHVIVDISDQLATYYHNGKATVITRVSTGSEKTYTYVSGGKTITAVAHSRRGTHAIYRQEGALHKSGDLGGAPGSMAWALYFDGGIALHTGTLPGYPASHGCTRMDRGNTTDPNDDALKLMRDNGLGIGDYVTVQD